MASLQEIVRRNITIPTIPSVASRLVACLENPDAGLDEVVAAVQGDPALVAALLRQANSAAFGLARRVATAEEAVRFLGMSTVRAMALATAVQQSYSTVPEEKLAMVWLLSHQTANTAQCLARSLGQPTGLHYTCGMLHAVGMLAMHEGTPQAMADLDAKVELWHLERARAERRAIGFDYADAGAMLLRAWNLPQPLVEGLAWQNEPALDGDLDMMSCVLHLAAWRVRAELADLQSDEVIQSVPHAVAGRVGLDPDLLTGDIPGREPLAPMRPEPA